MRTLLLVSLAASVAAQATNSSVLDLLISRRNANVAAAAASPSSVPQWISTQRDDGTWDDVNYLAGCPAQRANWPASDHWNRIVSIAGTYRGLSGSNQNLIGSSSALGAASKAMDWWFNNDYTEPACTDQGGQMNGSCPCGTPGLWNTNWFDQIILIPRLAGQGCLLLDEQLSDTQRASCERILARPWDLAGGFIHGLGYLTGANTIDVSSNTISLGLLRRNNSLVADAFAMAESVVKIEPAPLADGIKPDGSFLQHKGVEYTGNYGKDLINLFLSLQSQARGTPYAAKEETRQAFAKMIKSSEWMMVANTETGMLHWDINAIGRFISFPVSDNQASGSINVDLSQVAAVSEGWTGEDDLGPVIHRLTSNSSSSANRGPLNGNQHFWNSDYIIHRQDNYIQTLKLLSTRSANTECVNLANPYAFHLSTGSVFTFVSGAEYEDIAVGWDWELVPGTTVDRGVTPLRCNATKWIGRRDFVGAASDGSVAVAAMDWINPFTGSLAWQKAWFLWDGVTLVELSGVRSNTSAPIVTTLDQCRLVADSIKIDGGSPHFAADGSLRTSARTLWHGGVGYVSHGFPFDLTLSAGSRTGNWSAISTSTAGTASVSLFSAFNTHDLSSPDLHWAYNIYPASTSERVLAEAQRPSLRPLDLGHGISGAVGQGRLGLVFWEPNSAHIDLSNILPDRNSRSLRRSEPAFSISPSASCILLLATRTDSDGGTTIALTLADPTQKLQRLTVAFRVNVPRGRRRSPAQQLSCLDASGTTCHKSGAGVELDVVLPQGGSAGSSVQVLLRLE